MNNMSTPARLAVGAVDWEASWHAYQDARRRPGTREHWDKRAQSYGVHAAGRKGLGAYERIFLERAAIRPGETVLDMGCGVGLLAIPLAQQGHRVVCADFSAGMLEQLATCAEEAGVRDMLDIRQLAWDDDWEAAGLLADSVDVAIASRSLATYNLTDAITKLDRTARRRVCATVAAGRSPMRDERAFEAVGRTRQPVRDYMYVTNILFDHGIFPELSYVVTHSLPGFASREDAVERLTGMLGGDLSPEEQLRLDAFLDVHYTLRDDALPGRAYEADARREVRWAFVAWGDGNDVATDEFGPASEAQLR